MKKTTEGKNLPLGLAKITPPHNAQALARDHLFQKLDHLRGQPAIWITSPAGAGKTTLLSIYLESRAIPCLWYQVDTGDEDPATFFHYLGLAARGTVPNAKKAFPALTPEYLSGLATFTLRFFEDICTFLLSHYQNKKGKHAPGIALVFDGCQDVSPESAFHTIILNGLTRIPSGINVFLVSRNSPPPLYARLLANGQMGLLGWDDLRLSPTETEQIMRMRCRSDIARETIAQIHRLTEGWAAGLTLMLDMINREGFDTLEPQGITPEEIMYYFGSELFDRLDEPTRDFLMKSAFLPEMTVAMARELTGSEETGRILATLYRNNYFIHKHVRGVSSYEYHMLFREFLISKARDQLSPMELKAVIRSASAILWASGQVEAAMELIRRIADLEAMAAIIMQYAPGLIAQGRFRTLQEWLAPLPDSVMEGQPWLIYWKGAASLPADPGRAKDIFEQAFRGFTFADEREGQLYSLCGIIESIQLSFGDLRQYDPWIPVITELFPSNGEPQSRELEARLIDGTITALVLRRPDHPALSAWVDRAAALLEQALPLPIKARLIHAVLFYYILQFDVSNMDLVHDRLRVIMYAPNLPIETHLLIHLMEANYHVIKANHPECLSAVGAGLNLAQESGVHIMDHLFHCHAATSCLNENDPQQASEFLDIIAGHYDALSPWGRKAYHQVKAREALILKDGHQAHLHAAKTLELTQQLGLTVHVPLGCYLLAQSLHQLGQHAEERKYVRMGQAWTGLADNTTFSFHIMLLQATCAFDQSDDETGRALLTQAFALGRENGQLGTYGDIPLETARLCARALEEGIEPEYTRWLIGKRRLIPNNPPMMVDQWPWPVKIYTLGRFGLVVDERPVRFSRKAQQRPFAMLKVLIALGGREIREDQVADLLWPDAEGDLAHHAFGSTLHRLRKLLGYPDALQLREGRMTLDPRCCWVDAWALERLLNEAEVLKRQHRIDRALVLTDKAVRLYHGAFLAGELEEPWVVSPAERMRGKFLRGVRFLAQNREALGQWEQAVQCYEHCLDVDDCVEEVYQHLILCYRNLGRRDEALAVYRRCERTFTTVFGVEPSPATKRLRSELLKT